ncbi:GNAT family N-acetyltransferase [Epidermidibacterium keratini]|uniref:GNAT family N-acetyltransferase n=1 Tax=Epidermidibacterium keratini TaxID=1891644 RepID=UPI001CEF6CA8|nr:GNAT family N-acetyltransferase [Epidermidibacterium keratini]
MSRNRAAAGPDNAWESVTTDRLHLRRPVEADREFYQRVHTDPQLYRHAPHSRGTDESTTAAFDDILTYWVENGFDYWVVVERSTDERIGWAGVRRTPRFLNLYYRLIAQAHGRGLAAEAARAAVSLAGETEPTLPVLARVKEHNVSSVRTAIAAGLVLTSDRIKLSDDRRDDPPSLVFASRVGP